MNSLHMSIVTPIGVPVASTNRIGAPDERRPGIVKTPFALAFARVPSPAAADGEVAAEADEAAEADATAEADEAVDPPVEHAPTMKIVSTATAARLRCEPMVAPSLRDLAGGSRWRGRCGAGLIAARPIPCWPPSGVRHGQLWTWSLIGVQRANKPPVVCARGHPSNEPSSKDAVEPMLRASRLSISCWQSPPMLCRRAPASAVIGGARGRPECFDGAREQPD